MNRICRRITKTGGILYYSIVHPAFYGGDWLKDVKGYKYGKVIDKYIKHLTNEFWGKTEHPSSAVILLKCCGKIRIYIGTNVGACFIPWKK